MKEHHCEVSKQLLANLVGLTIARSGSFVLYSEDQRTFAFQSPCKLTAMCIQPLAAKAKHFR